MNANFSTSKNQWSILILAAITLAVGSALPLSSMPVLFKEIAADLNLDPIKIGLIWGIVSFGTIFTAPLGGMLSDKMGTKRTIVVLGLLAGLVNASRGLSDGFGFLMATTFLWGIICASMLPALNVIASKSLEKSKQGLAQGLLGAGGGFGLIIGSFISATLLSPLLGGWRHVFFVFGGLAVLISLVWFIFGKEPEKVETDSSVKKVPFREAFQHLIKLKELWLIGCIYLLFQGCMMGMQGFLPYHLQDYGWTTLSASGVLSAYSAVGTLSIIPFTLVSDHIGSRKLILFMSFALAAVSVGLMSIVHNQAVWILVLTAGLLAQVNAALGITMCIETTQLGSAYTGTAIGMLMSLSHIGRSLGPPLGNSLANISQEISWPFLCWASLAVLGSIVLLFVKETGRKIRKT